MSGATSAQPGYQDVIAAVTAGKVDVVVADALHRFSRDQADIALLYRTLKFHEVSLHTKRDGEVLPIHVGITGLMIAEFLNEMAAKTRSALKTCILGG